MFLTNAFNNNLRYLKIMVTVNDIQDLWPIWSHDMKMLSVISTGNNVAGPANFTVPATDIPNEFKDGSQGSPLGATWVSWALSWVPKPVRQDRRWCLQLRPQWRTKSPYYQGKRRF